MVSKPVRSSESDVPIREAVKQIAGALLVSDHGAELSYQLPFKSINQFPKLFDELDSMTSTPLVDSWGVSMTTMEEVPSVTILLCQHPFNELHAGVFVACQERG